MLTQLRPWVLFSLIFAASLLTVSMVASQADVPALPKTVSQDSLEECETACCAACTRCANGDDEFCDFCLTRCPLTE